MYPDHPYNRVIHMCYYIDCYIQKWSRVHNLLLIPDNRKVGVNVALHPFYGLGVIISPWVAVPLRNFNICMTSWSCGSLGSTMNCTHLWTKNCALLQVEFVRKCSDPITGIQLKPFLLVDQPHFSLGDVWPHYLDYPLIYICPGSS